MDRLDFFKWIGRGAAACVAALLAKYLPKAKPTLDPKWTGYDGEIEYAFSADLPGWVAGEDLEPGDFVYLADDGKLYTMRTRK